MSIFIWACCAKPRIFLVSCHHFDMIPPVSFREVMTCCDPHSPEGQRKSPWKVLPKCPGFSQANRFGGATKLRTCLGTGQCLAQRFPWVVVSSMFYFQHYLGKIPNLTNIFQMGWNHHLVPVFQDLDWRFKTKKKRRRKQGPIGQRFYEMRYPPGNEHIST